MYALSPVSLTRKPLLRIAMKIPSKIRSSPAALAGSEKLHKIVRLHIQQLFQIDPSVRVFPEGTLFRLRVRHLGSVATPNFCEQNETYC
jgi:hypothetical protein